MEIFSRDRLRKVELILGTDREDYIAIVREQVVRYRLSSDQNLKSARKDLLQLSAESLRYSRRLKKMRKHPGMMGIAETRMREFSPKSNLDVLADQVLAVSLASKAASAYLPGGKGTA